MSQLAEALQGYVGLRLQRMPISPDPVNAPMIRHWADVIGDDNPIYVDDAAARATGRAGVVAPAAMLQVWTMAGYRPTIEQTRHDDDYRTLLALLAEAGYTAIVATNSEHDYVRELRLGERIRQVETIESISAEKHTALGSGFFVTTGLDYLDEHAEPVGRALFRVLIYRPRDPAADPARRPRPPEDVDTAFWFQGAAQGKLLVQRCMDCGRLRHPPGPVCPRCTSLRWDTLESQGRGSVYSFVVNHHPQAPGFEYPLVVALVELDEGFRLVGGIAGVDPPDVSIGMPVQAEFFSAVEGVALPRFRRLDGPADAP
jgi:uncharacterized OB-fold protein